MNGGRRRRRGRQGEGEPRREPGPPSRERAWEYLLNLLARQAYTVAQLREKLARRKVDEAMAEELLARLVELRLVDDEVYAERFVEGRRDTHGRLVLRRELMRRGVDEEVAAPHIVALDAAQQAEAATALLRKNAWRYRPAPPEEDEGEGDEEDEHARFARLRRAEAKARAFLARRGFDPDAAGAAVEAVGWFEA